MLTKRVKVIPVQIQQRKCFNFLYLRRERRPFLGRQVVHPESSVNARIVPLPVPVIKTFSWFFHVADHVDGDPSVGGYHAGIRTAFKDGCEQVSVLFPFWTPVCRRLCQDAIVLKCVFERLVCRGGLAE